MRTSVLGAWSSGRLSLGIDGLRDVGLGHGRYLGFPLDGDLHIEERGAEVDGHGAARVLYRQMGDAPRANATMAMRSTWSNCASVSPNLSNREAIGPTTP